MKINRRIQNSVKIFKIKPLTISEKIFLDVLLVSE